MPNWCINHTEIEFADQESAKDFVEKYITKGERPQDPKIFDFGKLIPLDEGDSQNRFHDFRQKQAWGTKWPAALREDKLDGPSLSLDYDTANNPATKVLMHLVQNKAKYNILTVYSEAAEAGNKFGEIFDDGAVQDIKNLKENQDQFHYVDLSPFFDNEEPAPGR